VNANVFARGSQTSALIANTMLLLSRPKAQYYLKVRMRGSAFG
jgi:hypothetical protein